MTRRVQKQTVTNTFAMLDNLHTLRDLERKFLEGDIDIQEFGEKALPLVQIAITKTAWHNPQGAIQTILKLKLEISPTIKHLEVDKILAEWVKSPQNQWRKLFRKLRIVLGDWSEMELLDFLLYKKLQMNVKVKPVSFAKNGVQRLSRGHSVHARKISIKMHNKIQDKDSMFDESEFMMYGAFSGTFSKRNR